MRIPSGVTDQVIFFVAVDSTDLKTRETGLTSFTVYRARDTGAATVFTTPTVAELSAANMPGVYSLLLDEDMTIASGNDSEEMVFHITQASMAPVTRSIELYRRTVTSGETITVSSGAVSSVTTTTTATNVTTVNGLAANVITATSINADALTAAKFADDVSTEFANKTWDTDATGRQTQGTFGQAIGDPVADTNTIYKAVVTDATGATVGVDVVAVKAETASIQTDTNDLQTQVGTAGAGLTNINLPNQTMDIVGNITGNLSGSVGSVTAATTVGTINADVITATALAASAAQEIADEMLNRDLAGGGSGNTRNVRNSLRALRNKVSESGGTLTVTQEDDATPAWTATVIRTAATNPITSVDPA